MKRKLLFILVLLLLVGCNNKKELSCYKKDVEFDYGVMDRFVTFYMDNQDYITSATIKEDRKYNNEEDSFSFLDNNSEYTEKISDTELTYTEIKKYDEKVLSNEIKRAMEAQEYTCNYK